MDAQTFMYWAIGGGVILLVVFLCVALFYFIRILRDLSDATASVRDTAETVNENVQELADKVTSTADQILNYFVKPFALFQFLSEKIKPFLDMIPRHEAPEEEEYEEEEAEEEEPKKKRGARRSRSRRKKRD